jgi:hypothetical protein
MMTQAQKGPDAMNRTDENSGADPTGDRPGTAVATGTSRRTALRGLAAGLLAAASGGFATDTLAKQKRRKKGKHKPTPTPTPPTTPPPTTPLPKRCPQGTEIATVSVPSDGSQVFTPVLEQGQTYILRAHGYWSTSGEYMCDAFAAFRYHDERTYVLYDNGVRLGLWVDGESPDLSSDLYNLSHTYHFIVIGKGKPVSLQMLDSVYSDNGRDLYVDVLCGAPHRD